MAYLFYSGAAATKHSVPESEEQSQPETNLLPNTHSQALLFPSLDDAVTADQTVQGKYWCEFDYNSMQYPLSYYKWNM